METRENKPFPPTPVALGVLTAIVYVAGFTMVAAWFALVLLDQPRAAPAPLEAAACRICGVVVQVGEIERAGLELSGDPSEGFVVLLAALGGGLNRGGAPGRIYETTVRHDDGSVRIVRDAGAPHWKRGDRVKVVRGRIEPNVGAAATPRLAAAAPAASQPGRTPSPDLPAARAP